MLRYTCILETSSYVAGTTQILKNLDSYADETMTLAQFRVKNFWGKGDAYQGIIWDRGHLKLEKDGPVAYYHDGPHPPEGAVDQAALRHPLSLGPRNNNTLEISRSFVQAVKDQSSASLLNTFSSSINSHAAVLGANISDMLGGQRIVLNDLLTSDTYARFRQKPSQ